MKRFGVFLVVLAFLAGVLASTAAAGKPTRVFLPGEDFVLPEALCGFEIAVDTVVNNEYVTIFDDGRELVTGALKLRLTNLDDPTHSEVVSVSGPGLFSSTADGAVLEATGRWFWFFLPGELGPGHPGLVALSSGRVVVEIGEDGPRLTRRDGTWTDVCALLG